MSSSRKGSLKNDEIQNDDVEIELNADVIIYIISIVARHHIENCEFTEIIKLINLGGSNYFDRNPSFLFRLLEQQFIEYVRAEKIKEALELSYKELSHVAEKNIEFFKKMEKSFMLLIFPTDSICSELLDTSRLQNIAEEINATILTHGIDLYFGNKLKD
ncbi:uncharacterized protein LOC127253412 isoform X1 [Andrographis paniculata]|uniref:uncharacterized protein LOC127253412 isoform X1 n=2 Tax=Andrographis paniculata TaxID=175694 RepID=UPI0021E871F1|nr:uncharacterized protein LOC127253412 isoform X1 [Andrographis paniculata]